jgi:hypothetical protein
VRLLQGEGDFHQYLETEMRALLCFCCTATEKTAFHSHDIRNILRLKLAVKNAIINMMACLTFLVVRVCKKKTEYF